VNLFVQLQREFVSTAKRASEMPGPVVVFVAAALATSGGLVPVSNLMLAAAGGLIPFLGELIALTFAYEVLAKRIAGREELADNLDPERMGEVALRAFQCSLGCAPLVYLAWFLRFLIQQVLPVAGIPGPPSDRAGRALAALETTGDVLAFLIAPMAFALVAYFENGWMGFAYPSIARSIWRTGRAYGALLLKLMAILALPVTFMALVAYLPPRPALVLVGTFLSNALLFAALIMAALFVGDFYQNEQEELAWLEPVPSSAP
jgi:hypothetical protein